MTMPEELNTKSSALVAIDFHGDQLVTFQHGGTPHVAMRRVVENLGLAWQVQQRKLSENMERFACHHMVTHDTTGRQQEMLAMPVAKLPLWLATINPNKVPDPVKREKIELYQAESAIALHDYWTKGTAVRGDMEGIVTALDPDVMRALGGMMKGIVSKALGEILPAMVEREILTSQASVTRGLTAGEIVEVAGVTNRKGLSGLPRRVSNKLRRYCAEIGATPTLGHLGSSSAYVFDHAVVRRWLSEGGKQFIDRIVEEKRGQGVFKLVKAA